MGDRAPRSEKGSGGRKWRVLLLLAFILVVAAAAGLGVAWLLLRAGPEGRNAVWLGNMWAAGATREQIAFLGERLREMQIKTAYVYLADVGSAVGGVDAAGAGGFVRAFREQGGEARLLAWIRVIAEPTPSAEGEEIPPDWDLLAARLGEIVADAVGPLGFDGVLINIVGRPGCDPESLALIREARYFTGDGAALALSVPLPPLTSGDEAPLCMWTGDSIRNVGFLVNQIALLAFNSQAESAEDYAAWMGEHMRRFESALAELPQQPGLVIGVPSYGEGPVESLEIAIRGVGGAHPPFFEGIGLFAYWEMDALEWSVYRREWLE
jgi:hypothetical protein